MPAVSIVGLLMQYKLSEGSNEVVFMLFGALATGFGTVLQYFFGSSKSSSDKTQLMALGKITKRGQVNAILGRPNAPVNWLNTE